MAKKHSGGPGTYTDNGVVCTMDAPFSKGKDQRPSNKMKAPFDSGHSDTPTTVYANLESSGSKMPGQVAPSQQGNKRTGTKEYPYGGGSMRDGKSSGRP